MSTFTYIALHLVAGVIGYLLGRYPEKAKSLWVKAKEKFNA